MDNHEYGPPIAFPLMLSHELNDFGVGLYTGAMSFSAGYRNGKRSDWFNIEIDDNSIRITGGKRDYDPDYASCGDEDWACTLLCSSGPVDDETVEPEVLNCISEYLSDPEIYFAINSPKNCRYRSDEDKKCSGKDHRGKLWDQINFLDDET